MAPTFYAPQQEGSRLSLNPSLNPLGIVHLTTLLLLCLLLVTPLHSASTGIPALGHPQPGEVFRDHVWLPTQVKSDKGKFLRVGGKLDYRLKNQAQYLDDGYIPIGHYIDLENAVRAELILEKIGSHDGTSGLRVSFNGGDFIALPDLPGIPVPMEEYMHHANQAVEIPLDELKEGWKNAFALQVDPEQRFNWPQNLIYGAILRIYYNTETYGNDNNLRGVSEGDTLGETVALQLRNPEVNIRDVSYIAKYEGVNHEGDGMYHRFHYSYHRGKLINTLASSSSYPYEANWDTSWVPDQKEPIEILAWVTDNAGYTRVTPATGGLRLKREYSIELCKPYDQPMNWVTREQEFTAKFDLRGKPEAVQEVRVFWRSWSPCYSNGLFINGYKIYDRGGPCYEYQSHELRIENPDFLQLGQNEITTALEPLHNGKMVHGMEVQWPGPTLLVKFETRTLGLRDTGVN